MDVSDPRIDEIARRLSRTSTAGWDQQKRLLAFIQLPGVASFARGLGVDVDGILAMDRGLRESTVALLKAAVWFGEFGWAISAHRLKAEDYIEAVRLWETTHDQAVIDEHLTLAWSGPTWLRRSYGSLPTLAGRHRATRDMLLVRQRLLDKALGHHDGREYEAWTVIVLTQVDGLTFDFTDWKYGFFYDAKDHFFEDDATLAGMPDFLKRVRKAVSRDDPPRPCRRRSGVARSSTVGIQASERR